MTLAISNILDVAPGNPWSRSTFTRQSMSQSSPRHVCWLPTHARWSMLLIILTSRSESPPVYYGMLLWLRGFLFERSVARSAGLFSRLYFTPSFGLQPTTCQSNYWDSASAISNVQLDGNLNSILPHSGTLHYVLHVQGGLEGLPSQAESRSRPVGLVFSGRNRFRSLFSTAAALVPACQPQQRPRWGFRLACVVPLWPWERSYAISARTCWTRSLAMRSVDHHDFTRSRILPVQFLTVGPVNVGWLIARASIRTWQWDTRQTWKAANTLLVKIYLLA